MTVEELIRVLEDYPADDELCGRLDFYQGTTTFLIPQLKTEHQIVSLLVCERDDPIAEPWQAISMVDD